MELHENAVLLLMYKECFFSVQSLGLACLINHDFNFLLASNRNAKINITTSFVVLISDFIVVYFQFVEKTVTVLIQHTFVSLTCVTHQLSRSKVGFYQFSFFMLDKFIKQSSQTYRTRIRNLFVFYLDYQGCDSNPYPQRLVAADGVMMRTCKSTSWCDSDQFCFNCVCAVKCSSNDDCISIQVRYKLLIVKLISVSTIYRYIQRKYSLRSKKYQRAISKRQKCSLLCFGLQLHFLNTYL